MLLLRSYVLYMIINVQIKVRFSGRGGGVEMIVRWSAPASSLLWRVAARFPFAAASRNLSLLFFLEWFFFTVGFPSPGGDPAPPSSVLLPSSDSSCRTDPGRSQGDPSIPS